METNKDVFMVTIDEVCSKMDDAISEMKNLTATVSYNQTQTHQHLQIIFRGLREVRRTVKSIKKNMR